MRLLSNPNEKHSAGSVPSQETGWIMIQRFGSMVRENDTFSVAKCTIQQALRANLVNSFD